MSISLPDSLSNYKTCCKGANCVHPDGPTLPRSEFYVWRTAKDGLNPSCKACCKVKSKNHKGIPKELAGRKTEGLAIAILRDHGIYAAPGKSSEYHWVDVVAWGCVRIEVKTAQESNGAFLFGMGKKRRKEYERSDLVMLICFWRSGEKTYHLIPSNHPVFYHPDGRSKRGLQYITNPDHHKDNGGVSLTGELMMQYRDRFDLIAQVQQDFTDRLLQQECGEETISIKTLNRERAKGNDNQLTLWNE